MRERSFLLLGSLAAALGGLLLVACGPTSDEDDGNGGHDGGVYQTDGPHYSGGDSGPIDQPPTDDCAEAAKLVYIVDSDNRFSSFDPKPTPPVITDIGNLNCPAETDWLGVKATPFSMSVDREAVAWVLYSSGELFKVDTSNASCQATSFAKSQSGLTLFGMGFVSNSTGTTQETLYIAGGSGPGSGTGARLATIDMTSLLLSPGAMLTGWPEMTGNGLAELWGFFPDTTPPKVAKINKSSGAEEVVYPLSSLQGDPAAWAFAFWGGDFWVFLQRQTDTSTTVYQVSGADGSMTVALPNTGRHIVGAGVSTCAPVTID
jgi:hypothetical protein